MIVAALLAASLEIRGLHGETLRPLEPSGAANVLIFIATDCPVSNGYAAEIQRVCAASAAKGVRCVLVYEDVGVGDEAVRGHLRDFGYGATPAAIDSDGALARRVGATITPEVAVVDRSGAVRYRGRVDNKYVAIGRQRRVVTSHDLADALDAIVNRRAVAARETAAVGCFIVPPDMRRQK
jgi:hypothetical protein